MLFSGETLPPRRPIKPCMADENRMEGFPFLPEKKRGYGAASLESTRHKHLVSLQSVGVYIEDQETAKLTQKVLVVSSLTCLASALGALCNLVLQSTLFNDSMSSKRL